jgi:hypothetical protein
LQVEPELRLTVQQQYYDTQQRLGTALLNECSNFTPQGYSKVGVLTACSKHPASARRTATSKSAIIKASSSRACMAQTALNDNAPGAGRHSAHAHCFLLICLFDLLAPVLPALQLLEAYLLQGLPGPALAAKVLACFRDSISDAAMRLVRSMVLAKAAFSSPRESSAGGASSSVGGSPSARSSCSGLGDCTTEELCKLLSGEMVQPCLTKLLEVVFELLCSYRRMAQWHMAGIEQQQAAAAAAAAALKSHCKARNRSSSGGGCGDHAGEPCDASNAAPPTPSQAELDEVQAATSSMLEAVAGGLASSRMDIIEVAGARVCELLSVAKKCKGDDFTKVRIQCIRQLAALGQLQLTLAVYMPR